MLIDAKPSTTLKGLKNQRNQTILAGCYIDLKFNSVPRDHEKFAFTWPLCWCILCMFCDWERTLFIKLKYKKILI